MPRGTDLNETVQSKIVEALRAGNTRRAAAAYAGVSENTFHEWMARGRGEDPDRPLKKHKMALFYGELQDVDPSRVLLPWEGDPPAAGWVKNSRGEHYNEPKDGRMLIDVYRESLARLHAKSEHSQSKPEPWIRQLIGCCFQPDRVVYDPFLGSGTTLVACESIGRLCHGVEIDVGYAAVILQRCADVGLSPQKIC